MAFREDQVAAAVTFLTHDRGLRGWIADKEDFLFQKGLSQSEVSEALRRALTGGPVPGPSQGPPVLPGWPNAWYALTKPRRRLAPWWVLLLSGLGIGMAVSLLLRFFAWRRAATVQRQNALAAREAAAALVDPERQKLKELMAALVSGSAETREATASLRRSAEQQERLYQMSASDFQRGLEEAQRKKGKRMEIAPDSWKLLRSLVASHGFPTSGTPEDSKKLQEWFQDVEVTLGQLLADFHGDRPGAKRSLQTLSLILQNSLSGPKSREVNVKSARFQETFGRGRSAAQRLLELAGFAQNGEGVVALPAATSQAEHLFDILQHALRKDSGVISSHIGQP
ncbi:unnamed protein product [Cladocopium goreaui]|uniref:PUB domain-containing protein n=2 Tax=Cladocopium goreaui TaxID=2562237 RepID=A0A9P1CQ82_9DINO|nr:unnamed protein product [Cladocopium goreaui]